MDTLKKRVSFDFDSTLSEGYVQAFAKWCVKRGCEVWVVTSRLPDHKAPADNWNNDLWFVCNQLNVPKERVVFTSYTSKHEFFWSDHNGDFLFHLDDDEDEIKMLNVHCPNLVAMNHLENLNWERELTELVE